MLRISSFRLFGYTIVWVIRTNNDDCVSWSTRGCACVFISQKRLFFDHVGVNLPKRGSSSIFFILKSNSSLGKISDRHLCFPSWFKRRSSRSGLLLLGNAINSIFNQINFHKHRILRTGVFRAVCPALVTAHCPLTTGIRPEATDHCLLTTAH